MSVETVITVRPALEQSEEHVPERPSWQCRTCGSEWPCTNARASLVAECITSRIPMLVYLGMCQADATVDLSPGGLPPDLYDRFIEWARRQP